jgi:glycosyltransferase involved in cell wall biosynthesis
MRTLATLATPGTYTNPGDVLVGRTVANAQFLRALVRYGSFEELALLTGEEGDLAPLERLTADWGAPEGRLAVYSVWQLPELLQRGAIDVLHHASHAEKLYDLLAVRDRYATRTVPVTGQIHSLSYPRIHQELARQLLIPPRASDALFCSSTAGRRTLEAAHTSVVEALQSRGVSTPLASWNLPHVPLGVDLAALQGGARAPARRALGLPDDAVVLLGLARFTEYDKLDAFPLLQVLARLVHAAAPGGPPLYLLLAGARQGTKTPEMLDLWARALGVGDRLKLKVDFAEAEKPHLLAAADVFVSPVDNVQETFGQSVVEAMAAGLPVVVSDFDGYKDTVDETVGRRVSTRLVGDWSELSHLAPLLYERPLHLALGQSVEVEASALEDALRELITSPALRQMLGAEARARAARLYAWERVIPRYEAVWSALAQVPFTPPTHRDHPLRLDFEAQFGHFVTRTLSETQRVVRTPFSRGAGRPWVIYPELKHLLLDSDVHLALAFCERPKTVAQVREALRPALADRPEWVSRFVVGWLLKHDLLGDAP